MESIDDINGMDNFKITLLYYVYKNNISSYRQATGVTKWFVEKTLTRNLFSKLFLVMVGLGFYQFYSYFLTLHLLSLVRHAYIKFVWPLKTS